MRKLILIPDDLYVRSFVRTGALAEIDDEDTYWTAPDSLASLPELSEHPRWAGAFSSPPERAAAYERLRMVAIAALRGRSETMAIKTAELPWRYRWQLELLALPPLRRLLWKRTLSRIGLNPSLQAVIDKVEPDLIVAPTAGTDAPEFDAIRATKDTGTRTLLLVNGWDNISSKSFFPVLPDEMAVWGEQSADHAASIHGMPRDHVHALGVPTFDGHFAWRPEGSESPFPFPYVLFAGCALPFDERTALRELERAVARHCPGDVRIVYRPHPWRQPRLVDDSVREEGFERLVIDPQVRDRYLGGGQVRPSDFLPGLDYYPALLGHALCVVCPLSTMTLEAAITDTPVVVLTYDDGRHSLSLDKVARFSHFAGTDRVDGFELVPRLEELDAALERTLARGERPPLRPQIKNWLHYDDDPYARRLARLVERL